MTEGRSRGCSLLMIGGMLPGRGGKLQVQSKEITDGRMEATCKRRKGGREGLLKRTGAGKEG
jgi:hypothetical protein